MHEDFSNYRLPAMFLCSPTCGGKCCIEAGIPLSVCQNDKWRNQPAQEVPDEDIIERYLENPITKAIVFGGLEPFEQFWELVPFIEKLRWTYNCMDDVVIYTGYNKKEIEKELLILKGFPNIIVKFGRYHPNDIERFDDILGVTLASSNQYAQRIS